MAGSTSGDSSFSNSGFTATPFQSQYYTYTWDTNIVEELKTIRTLLQELVQQQRATSLFSDLTKLMKQYAETYERTGV